MRATLPTLEHDGAERPVGHANLDGRPAHARCCKQPRKVVPAPDAFRALSVWLQCAPRVGGHRGASLHCGLGLVDRMHTAVERLGPMEVLDAGQACGVPL